MMKTILGTAALCGLLLINAPGSSAAPIVTNGSFEAGLTGWGTSGFGTTPGIGVTVITTGGVNSTSYGDNVPSYDGTHAAYFVDDNASQNLFQTVSLQAGNVYTLSLALFATVSGAANPFNFTLEDSIGTNVLQTLTNSGSGTAVPVGVWTPQTYNFTVSPSGSYLLNFHFTSGITPAKDLLLDAVAINAVPEPFSLALLGAGLVGLGIVRRQRR